MTGEWLCHYGACITSWVSNWNAGGPNCDAGSGRAAAAGPGGRGPGAGQAERLALAQADDRLKFQAS